MCFTEVEIGAGVMKASGLTHDERLGA